MCRAGAAGQKVEWLAEMNNLPMEVRAYARTGKEGQPAPARADIVAISRWLVADMATAIRWQSLLIPKHPMESRRRWNENDLPPLSPGCRIRRGNGTCAANKPKSLPEALQNPVWDLYLGRKAACPASLSTKVSMTAQKRHGNRQDIS